MKWTSGVNLQQFDSEKVWWCSIALIFISPGYIIWKWLELVKCDFSHASDYGLNYAHGF